MRGTDKPAENVKPGLFGMIVPDERPMRWDAVNGSITGTIKFDTSRSRQHLAELPPAASGPVATGGNASIMER